MSRYKAYPEYKDSGIDCVGLVPVGWKVKKLKWEIFANSGTDAKDEHGEFELFGANGVIGKTNTTIKNNANGTVLVGRVGSAGAINFVVGKVGISDNAIIIRNFAHDAVRFDYYVFLSQNLSELVSKNAQPLITASSVRDVKVPLPFHEHERKTIANFLDHETAKIDTLIVKQQELIKLLKEKRQAVISHAVTKGLNPNAPMRDSGVEWLGEVPAHWGVKRIGALFLESNSRASSPEELEYPILSVSIHHGISDKELNEEELDRKVTRSDDKSLYKIVHQNDLAYNMMRAWQGGFGASTLSGLVSPAYVVCKPLIQLNTYYFELVLRTPNAVVELKKYSRGITDFRLRLYWDEFKCIEVPVPPETEADDILDVISSINKTYDNLIVVAEDQIALLHERRTALISAAVTGKIDVRDWQASNVSVDVSEGV